MLKLLKFSKSKNGSDWIIGGFIFVSIFAEISSAPWICAVAAFLGGWFLVMKKVIK
jgi:hypothetical protein